MSCLIPSAHEHTWQWKANSGAESLNIIDLEWSQGSNRKDGKRTDLFARPHAFTICPCCTAWLAHSCPPIRLYSFQRRIQVAAEARGFVVLRFQVPTSSEICPCWVDSELACEKPCACEHCLFRCTAHLHTSWWSVCVSCERMPNSRSICCFNANVKSISIHYRFGSFFSLTPSAP